MPLTLHVKEKEGRPAIHFPLEEDKTLLSWRIDRYFRGHFGLQYRDTDTNSICNLRLIGGKFYPPEGGWNGIVCLCERLPTSNNEIVKRKSDDIVDGVAEKRVKCDTKLRDIKVIGLNSKTTEAEICELFSKFGHLGLVSIKRDSEGVSKGFGFIRFTDYSSQERVMNAPSPFYSINGRWCELKVPNSKIKTNIDELARNTNFMESKIFVGCCAPDITPSDLRQYFSQYGEVTHVCVPPSKAKPYAFVTFFDEKVARSLWGEDHIIKGHSVNVRPAKKSDPQNEKMNRKPSDKSTDISATTYSSQSRQSSSGEIKNTRLSDEVFTAITDIIIADRLGKFHPPVYYTNMLSKKVTLLGLAEKMKNEGQLLTLIQKFQGIKSEDLPLNGVEREQGLC